jgi:hypothetical protein
MQINNFKILDSHKVKESWNGWLEGVNIEHTVLTLPLLLYTHTLPDT